MVDDQPTLLDVPLVADPYALEELGPGEAEVIADMPEASSNVSV